MIIQKNRAAVIENIRLAAQREDFHAKVETEDPTPDAKQSHAIVENYLKNRPRFSFRCKTRLARLLANFFTFALNRNTQIVGMEKLAGLSDGAVITSNHFGPTENTVIRHLVKKLGRKRLNVVAQVSNFAMTGPVGFLMNYADTIPMAQEAHYMQRDFTSILESLMQKDELVLIYPEQEMWFNYRKPRPCKRGAYYYAARLNVPLISCFVEMQDLPEMDTEEFHKVRFVLHILEVLYPDKEKDVRENSLFLRQRDYDLKKAAYEKVYGKTLTYDFEPSDIAGWTGKKP